MSKSCPIMERMKKFYEDRAKTSLTRRTPVIIRIDGKAFHTYTSKLDKPFDEGLIKDMQETTKFLCKNIQGAKCGYVQSDEISILITDYDQLTTDAWFGYNVQKMTSVSASLATGKFNQLRMIRYSSRKRNHTASSLAESIWDNDNINTIDLQNFVLANFDSRVFNIPKDEVNNYFIARQKDAVKNSISMLAHTLYSSTNELHGKNGNEKQEMCFQKGHNWNDLHNHKKRGALILKKEADETNPRSSWIVLEDTPEFTTNKIIETLI